MEVKGIRHEAFDCEKYVSGKSMEDVMADYGLTSVVKLGSNENMYGPYDVALNAMGEEVKKLNIYPEKNYIKLKKVVGEKFGVDGDWVSLGHGAGNVLDEVAKTLLEDGDEVLVPQQSYRLYREISKIMGAKVIEVPLNDNYTMELKDFKEKLTDKTKIVWICNPNNPTGSVLTKEEVRKIVKSTDALIALDEAYMEFGDESLIDEVMDYDNLLIVKTVSKAFSLAGIRMGYIVANEDIITSIEKVRAPYNLNSLSTYIATEALRQKERMFDYVKNIKEEREKIYKALVNLGVKAYKSSANFVFFKSDIDNLQKKLVDKDVLIRKFSGKLDGYYRVSVGTKEQNEELLKAFKEVM